jgi:hypothetical protein
VLFQNAVDIFLGLTQRLLVLGLKLGVVFDVENLPELLQFFVVIRSLYLRGLRL